MNDKKNVKKEIVSLVNYVKQQVDTIITNIINNATNDDEAIRWLDAFADDLDDAFVGKHY